MIRAWEKCLCCKKHRREINDVIMILFGIMSIPNDGEDMIMLEVYCCPLYEYSNRKKHAYCSISEDTDDDR